MGRRCPRPSAEGTPRHQSIRTAEAAGTAPLGQPAATPSFFTGGDELLATLERRHRCPAWNGRSEEIELVRHLERPGQLPPGHIRLLTLPRQAGRLQK
jgi:hypothetical protein